MSGFESVEIKNIEECGNEKWRIVLSVPLASEYYSGHFDTFPILPAVAEIDIIKNLTNLVRKREIVVRMIKKTKFTSPVFPDREYAIELDYGKDGVIRFAFKDESGALSSQGTLEYALWTDMDS